MTLGKRLWRAGLSLALLLALAFVVVAPPEHCPPVTAEELRESSQAAMDWFVRNQETDGAWLYLYDTDDDTVPDEYNEVRHAGVTMGLYQAAAAGLPGALRSADRGTEWALDRLLRRDGWAALEGDGRVTTGASALLAAGLVIRRDATGDGRYDDVLDELGRFLLAQTEPSGAVLASYDAAGGAPVPDEYSKYYTGEAYWALGRLHLAFPGEGWGEAADRIGAYLATSRDDVEGHWPPIPDHWAAYGAAETAEFPERGSPPLTGDEWSYARDQAELFGAQARWLAHYHGPWGGIVRGGYEPRGGWYGVVGGALTGWWLAARADPRLADLQAPLAERATCIAGLAIDEQSTAEEAADATQPVRVEGAWFIDGETRMDDQQHALAGLLRTIPIVEAGEGDSSDAGENVPSAWLWAAVLLLALNPARAAFGVLGVCAAAAVADPLIDALDVSEPSLRTAAGIVAVITGVADLLRRPPPPEPALAGRRAALVPVSFPLVARPALLVIALGAGADRDFLLTAAAGALGVGLLTALTAAGTAGGPRARALRWAGRLLGVGLVACGAPLTIDGVLDV